MFCFQAPPPWKTFSTWPPSRSTATFTSNSFVALASQTEDEPRLVRKSTGANPHDDALPPTVPRIVARDPGLGPPSWPGEGSAKAAGRGKRRYRFSAGHAVSVLA